MGENCTVCSVLRKCKNNHYGAPVCIACKSFFLRCVRNRRKKIPMIECRTLKHSCDVTNDDKNSRSLCPPCRWKKCLEFGMQESLVKPVKEKSKNQKPDKYYLESLLGSYRTCFPPKEFLKMEDQKTTKMKAEFILDWNKSTLDCLTNFVNMQSEFHSFEMCEKEVILLHNVKSMQFIIMSVTIGNLTSLQSFLPLLTYNAIQSQDLMKILLEIQLLKLTDSQIVLSLVLCLFNIPNLPRNINDEQNTSKKIEYLLEDTFNASNESWKWKVLSENIKTLYFYTSSIYLKTQEIRIKD